MKLQYFGHSTFLITVADKKILFDPFITPNELAKDIDIKQIEADYILVTHGHEDHVADVEAIAKNTGAVVVSNFEVVSWFQEKGLENVHPMNHGGSKTFNFGNVKYVNAIHSSTLPDGTPGGNPGGFVVSTEEGTFYFAGDTALTYDMKLIGEEFKLDFAIMPIGDNFTMGIKDACKAADFVGTNKFIGMHYDTFPYIQIDEQDVKKSAQEAGKELIMLNIGEIITL
ncbi:metal-dependent hydrolase [Litoribacter ruber]|uniref:metal-dependent hydrolase n=1 Tax=Litoribacter ruber TaxID=702568 RepID=UPI001BD9BB49|nr:metal-dependent hydrolase [Litoribacter ruber]MBT0810616.1 metal-dependent hydrolase [Litoribacter ruber]